jgi:sialate O-acetylesterase
MRYCLLLTLLFTPLSAAEVGFAGIFTDRAVLQREVAAPEWGWGDPGEQVTLTFAGQTKTATADATSKWQVTLDPIPASAAGRELLVQSGSENRKSKISDVLVGDVWLCSGQSNMALLMLHVAASHPPLKDRLDKANNPQLRLCSVRFSSPAEPLSDVKCSWQTAGPQSANLFSTIGYLFGEIIQRETGVPVGIISASCGGTSCPVPKCPNRPPCAMPGRTFPCATYITGKASPPTPSAQTTGHG